MVKTRRSNGENGEVDDRKDGLNVVGIVSSEKVEKVTNWSQRELRSNLHKVKRKIPHWPTKYSRRNRTIKMPRIVYPESDTEPEKYSRRSRQMRVFFAADNDSSNRNMLRRTTVGRKNYMEDSEDKPIQQNVRRSCRKRKLLHHNFNESWITNELKVKGYPDLYGIPGFSSTDEFTSDEARHNKKLTARNNPPNNMDEDTQLKRQRRTSARFSNKKTIDATESDSENENNETVIEKKPLPNPSEETQVEQKMETNDTITKEETNSEQELNAQENDSVSNQAPVRSTRAKGRVTRGRKKEDNQQDTGSDSSWSESGSELTISRQLRRSNRTRQPKPAFVQIAQRQRQPRAETFTLRKKTYSLRERKPKILRRKTIRSQSPSSISSNSSSDSDEDLNVSMKNKTKGRQKTKSMDNRKSDRALRDIQPVELDGRIRFSSVGGLEEHIKCLREMVLFPIMYPDLFKKFDTRPAKGVLFHGPPGTGKTLLALALANECSVVGGRKVSFFMRKGADCLKKWVGGSERLIKLLFQQANKMQPSIIFFDEIDALAPVRSVRQEQVHTSVVGTLLAEMDGLCDRGDVVVIGATNRLDAVDPALRRAGRFDRELHFPSPHEGARRDILQILTGSWNPTPSAQVLDRLAHLTTGYGGSDLKALCSEAVLKALRRVYPQVYASEDPLLIDTKNVEVRESDLVSAMGSLVAAGARTAPPPARRLLSHVAPLLSTQLHLVAAKLEALATLTLAHSGESSSSAVFPASASELLIMGECAETLIAPPLLAELEHCTVKEISMSSLHSVLAFTQEQALISVFSECRRADRGCVLYVREAVSVCRSLGAGGAALLVQLWQSGAAGDRTLLIASVNTHVYDDLPSELQELFPEYKDCIYKIRAPNSSEVINFLKPIMTEAPLEPPVIVNTEPPPPLPRAPPPPPPRESAEEVSRRKRKEDYKLRELRIFLRDICRKLASNRRFYKFTKPVDLEEVKDYLDIIKEPMDLETMMTKVDMHKYNCAKEFLDDIDLICANALEYNPDRTSSDKQIRHEACSLRDHAHALIDVEMDSDFEVECQDIARKRREEGTIPDTDLPDFIYTASNLPHGSSHSSSDIKTPRTVQNGDKNECSSSKRKRRRINAWSKGLVVKRQRTTPKTYKECSAIATDEECKENKPIASTPLPNGECSTTSGSEDDQPLRRPHHDADGLFDIAPHHNHHVLDSPKKTSGKTSPKKRNSGHDSSAGGAQKVLINKTELDNLLYKNVNALRCIGLQPLLDLHSQLAAALRQFANKYDRTTLPQEFQTIISRYVQLARDETMNAYI